MTTKEEYDSTTNRAVYNKHHKELHASCSRCAWNRGCNRHRKRRGRNTLNWKSFREKRYVERGSAA